MQLDRTNWTALVDDDGSNTVGTLWTKDKIKTVLLDPIDAALIVGFPDGAATTPSIFFTSNNRYGIYFASGGIITTSNGTPTLDVNNGGLINIRSTYAVSWASTDDATVAPDLLISRDAANTSAQKNGNADQLARSYAANGGYWEKGSASELLTLSIAGATTDTSANLLPANAIIEAVVARVTTTITTATNWKLGDATIAGRFTAADSTMTSGETQVGLVHVDQTGTSGPRQTAAAKVRVTTTGTPGAGVIRITVFYRKFVPPTS